MNEKSIAPCGIICDICLGYQREKNKCVGCLNAGYKPHHCEICGIKMCPEKNGNEATLCGECEKFPCKRIRDLDKRYKTKYGESVISNFQNIQNIGIKEFIKQEEEKWKCPQCGHLLCVHKEVCLTCGGDNKFFPVS